VKRRPARQPTPVVGPVRELAIVRMGAQSDGISDDGVFVAGALPGEQVRAAVTGDRGELVEVLQASAERVTPPCPHFGRCGGCSLQHLAEAPQLAWKAEQIRQDLARERIETDILPAFAAPPGSRRRLALHARKGGPEGAVIGFKARRSWSLVPIEVCPVADLRLVAAFPALRRLAAGLFENPKSAPILHVTLTETGLDVDVSGVERKAGGLSADARQRVAEAAAAADFARVSLDGEALYQSREAVVRIGPAMVALPPGGFLQAVAEAEAAMAAFALEALSGAKAVADLYCGVGAFALRLATQAPVNAYDISAPAIKALSAAQASATSLKPIRAEARDLVRRPVLAEDLKRIDAVVIDPPRAGAYEQHRELARSGVARVVGVSCNPSTFARDARLLIDAGFVLERLMPVDQFLWSAHIELVGLFARRT